jgi:hypothetical protein
MAKKHIAVQMIIRREDRFSSNKDAVSVDTLSFDGPEAFGLA